MRIIGPMALDKYVGDRLIVYTHLGRGKYCIEMGRCVEGSGEDYNDFYLEDSKLIIDGSVVRREGRIPISHGIVLMVQDGSVMKDYVFIDESD
jgi:hypothetical protein